MRSSRASRTWVATPRPKRAVQATGRGSLLEMAPVASPSWIAAPEALASVRVKVS